MDEDDIMAVIGRLYVQNLVRQRKVDELERLVQEYERIAKMNSDPNDGWLPPVEQPVEAP